ncbi:hypothetical protein AXG93_4461s1380 [Marchantia polymorpha subsp. ruderalis]|uniref:Transmembrane protein 45B n=1 Tax=Marchantia polymorpha subsp. ruderalis TaxID=1480154 RepID=A0A176WPY6_MARPO|nr:hypothetical protein AXG93_4461s1380 [Marchantia polymorpha subsp. ruderalis]
MGTLTGHLIPAFFFFTFGLWHLFSASVNYLRHPREYCARAWQPVPFVSGKLRSLELYVLLITIPMAIFYELGISTSFEPLENGVIPIYRIASFQHSVVLLMFWLFAALVLLSESTSALPLPYELPFVLIGLAFLVELTVIGQEAALNAGLEGKCYVLLSFVIGGSWLFQTGLSLYVENFIPEGCHRLLDLPGGVNGSTQCDLDEAKLRARGLMGFAFNCHVTLVVLFGVLALGMVARLQGYRRGGYDPISLDMDNDHMQLKPLGKLSFDKR